jgi:hypothetical protein
VRRGRKATGLRREDSRAAEGNAHAFFLLPGFFVFSFSQGRFIEACLAIRTTTDIPLRNFHIVIK